MLAKNMQAIPKKLRNFFSVLIVLIVASVFLAVYLIDLVSLTLTLIGVGVAVALGAAWFLLGHTHHRLASNVFMFSLLGFALAFLLVTTLFSYGFIYSLSGPIVPYVSYPAILDASLGSYFNALVQSPQFSLLQTIHSKTIVFQELEVVTSYSNAPGGLQWVFYMGDLNCKLEIGQSGGKPYEYYIINWVKDPIPQDYPSSQVINLSFAQIDSIGLHWFYNQSISEYVNATGALPTITDLRLDITYDSVGSYQGIVLFFEGIKQGYDQLGNKVYPTVFQVEFQPNGTILASENSPGM